MNKKAITKHEIFNKLTGFSEQDLNSVVSFIDSMRHKKKINEKKVIKLEGILKGFNIDLSSLEELKKKTWQHVEKEINNG